MQATTSKSTITVNAEERQQDAGRNSSPKFAKGVWRLMQPLRYANVGSLFKLPGLYLKYFRDLKGFKALGGEAPFSEVYPALFDATSATQSGGGHYFYQDVWALSKLSELKPHEHHDIGSRIDGFVGQATAICPVVYWDLRDARIALPNFEFRFGSLPNLPLPDQSVSSLSCLHVLEHIGLGRYGDNIDPDGTRRSMVELMRIVAVGGHLLVSLPVGHERVCFNAERVWNPLEPVKVLSALELIEFKAVSDDGLFLENVTPSDLIDANNSCGLYLFRRPRA